MDEDVQFEVRIPHEVPRRNLTMKYASKLKFPSKRLIQEEEKALSLRQKNVPFMQLYET